MSEQSPNGEPGRPSPESDKSGEGLVWSAISTLVAGPAVWGAIGWLVDNWLDTGSGFTAAGVVVGFITSFYLIWLKFGRD